MGRKTHGMTSVEISMRAVLFVQSRVRSHRLIVDYAEMLMDRFEITRPTGYRLARYALDCLGVTPAPSQKRRFAGQVTA